MLITICWPMVDVDEESSGDPVRRVDDAIERGGEKQGDSGRSQNDRSGSGGANDDIRKSSNRDGDEYRRSISRSSRSSSRSSRSNSRRSSRSSRSRSRSRSSPLDKVKETSTRRNSPNRLRGGDEEKRGQEKEKEKEKEEVTLDTRGKERDVVKVDRDDGHFDDETRGRIGPHGGGGDDGDTAAERRGNRECTVSVSGLSRNVTEDHLKEIFSNFGSVVTVQIPIDRKVSE